MDNPSIKAEHIRRFDLQRRIVSHMTSSSWQNVPHVSYIYEPDITEFYSEFQNLADKCSNDGFRLTFNTVMIKMIAEGLLDAPELNAHIEYNYRKSEGSLNILGYINITLPWTLPNGKMITPAIQGVEKLSLKGISESIYNLSERIEKTNIDEMFYEAVFADTVSELKKFNLGVFKRIFASKITKYKVKGLRGKEKAFYYDIPEKERLTYKNLRSGTVTVSNIGSLYKDQKGFFALLEIIPPQVFAVGLGSIQERAGVVRRENGDKELGIRKVLPMCLVFDHRAVDFNTIIPFVKKLDEIFANPEVIQRW